MATEARPIVVIGGGGHANVLLYVLSRLPEYRVLGYVDPRDNGPLLGFPRLGGDEKLPELAKGSGMAAAIGIGKVRAGGGRMALLAKLRDMGFRLPAIIAPSAVVAGDAILGEATVVMDGAVVQPGCKIGEAVIVNTGALVDHGCTVGADVHLATGSRLSGAVSVGDGSLLGVGSSVIQLVRIGPGCTIGAGAAVIADCLVPGTYVGVPARRVAP